MRLQISIAFIVATSFSVASCISLKGYVKNTEMGTAYKLFYRSQPWAVAKEICEAEGAKLAVPRSEEEFLFIQKLVRGMHYPAITNTSNKLVVWLGISNVDNYKIWTSVDGKDIRDTGFARWSGMNGQISASPKEPHCAVLDAVNPGLRDWWCHRNQPFICKVDLENSWHTQTD
ncbi:unnamed protein product [Parnassius mnemosyne]|uniref:C-type lectin domain-containing protein n=1 Tax=Parnassius mnemosyne TaxID=213953 RepID=A0AAV1KLY0_9NEOP